MNQTLLESVLAVLKQDSRLVSEEGELLKNKTQELAYKLDPELIGILLKNPLTKEKFFKEIGGYLIFNQDAFVSFVTSKDWLPDSYTKYANTIGLNIDGKTLNERKEVSLIWAYKDCVLAGGQDKEDAKRDEIFYNEILGSDQIDRLLDPKVFTEFKRIDKDGKHTLEGFKRDKNGNIKDNLIIKGNNLLALHSLKKQFRGQIKLIYIDPPYYFHSKKKEDTFAYNSNFKLPSWLTFMRNRLVVAQELLSEDGSIAVQISDDGVGELHLLLKEIFNTLDNNNFLNKISIKTKSPSGFASVNAGVFETAEYILLFAKNKRKWTYNQQYVETSYDENYRFIIPNKESNYKTWIIEDLFEHVAKKRGYKNKKEAEKIFSDFGFLKIVSEFAIENADKVFRYTAIGDDAGKETIEARDLSNANKNVIYLVPRTKNYDIYIMNGEEIAFYSKKIRDIDGNKVPTIQLSNIWTDVPYEGIAKEGGVTLKGGKKPEKLLRRIIEMCSNEGDLIMDYHLGSGTTGGVAHKLARQYIGVEQMDYGEDDSVIRIQNVIQGDKTGISKSIKWKGGGDFVYMEIACDAEKYIEMIRDAKTAKALLELWEEMKGKSFLNYKLDPKSIDNTLEAFKALPLEDQKKTLIDLIDKNALYKNLSEMEDKESDVSEVDKKLNRDFYNL